MIQLPPEKLGSFYLGAKYDIATKSIASEQVNYDSRDLTTHAVCVGMTGSGKTGLCIGLLEEAAIDKVPAIIIDPKGDMTNLLLQFENLLPEDFEPWINKDDAGRKGLTPNQYAKAMAQKWEEGLAEWGQGKQRIKDLKNAVDYTVYTPGSNAGISINILGSFAAPKINFDDDAEMFREKINGTVAALLGMVDPKKDPVRSKEAILLANLFEHFWRNNEDLELASLIQAIQDPPFTQLGVFDIETFFPKKERFELAMNFNTLIASPQFRYWLQGEDLDIEKIYFTEAGKPRHSIFYIAHLSEQERMFFVTLLLNALISWMRRQSGTTSLRSLLYFDEIFGYFPPTAQPPSKKPLLTLLKQARAYGLGTVLVTQNPVDIDYKGLSNAGTWFIGKLQTERDKERVLEGLRGAIAEAGAAETMDLNTTLSALSSRVFLMHNIHAGAPTIYHTRWAMSYLRGPLTRPQVKQLMQAKKSVNQSATMKPATRTRIVNSTEQLPTSVATPPSIDPKMQQRFFTIRKSAQLAGQELSSNENLSLLYEPQILATAKVRFYDEKRNVDQIKPFSYIIQAPDEFGRSNWADAQQIINWEQTLLDQPDHNGSAPVNFAPLQNTMNDVKDLAKIEKDFGNWLYQTQRYFSLEHPGLKLYQTELESSEAFQMRVQQIARELRDEELDEVQDKFEPKFEKIQDRIRKEERELDEAKEEVKDRKTAEWIGMAETVFSVFVKRRSRSISAATSKSRMRRKAAQKVEASKEDIEKFEQDYRDLETDLKKKLDQIRMKWDKVSTGITRKEIKPRRTDIKIDGTFLVWQPYWVTENGSKTSALK